MLTFCYDSLGKYGIGYPNLAPLDLAPSEFDSTWPRAVPLRWLMFLEPAGITINATTVDTAPRGSWYPVAVAWFDHSCDYFSLMSPLLVARLQQQEIRVLFYYHEGDNPAVIKQRLDGLCSTHNLPLDCYVFVSANSAADQLDNFVYFPDHEYFFRYVNRRQLPVDVTDQSRPYEFTALNRTHKWWRATCMADLHSIGVLDNSLWSYNTTCLIDDQEVDNPIQLDCVPDLKNTINQFLSHGPYFCDGDHNKLHNDHRGVNLDLYLNSYCHLIIETFFDADGSGGAFITEKTTKAIKYGQPFVMIGAPGSLRSLREQGYRTFDNVIDNSYDDIVNNTDRWLAIRRVIQDIQRQDMHEWFKKCLPDIHYNQQLFQNPSYQSLHHLIEVLHEFS